jgi:alkylation response protein AidB-like acyl-CoA dehydrogenase
MSAIARDSAISRDSGADGSAAVPDYVSSWKDDEVRELGALADKFIGAELIAKRETWESQHYVDPDVWRRAGEIGLLCCSIPAQYGGGGGTFAHDLAVFESQARRVTTPGATACTAASWPTTSWPTAPRTSAGAGCRSWPRAS